MSLLQDLQDDIAEQRPVTFEAARDIVDALMTAERDAVHAPPISLDMYIAYREEFHSGLILWLGNDEAANLSPETRTQLSRMTFERRARNFFRLSLWNRQGARAADTVADIPDGANVFVPRVTGLRLWDTMAQGNASRVEHMLVVEDEGAAFSDTTRDEAATLSTAEEDGTPVGNTVIGNMALTEPTISNVIATAGETTPRELETPHDETTLPDEDLVDGTIPHTAQGVTTSLVVETPNTASDRLDGLEQGDSSSSHSDDEMKIGVYGVTGDGDTAAETSVTTDQSSLGDEEAILEGSTIQLDDETPSDAAMRDRHKKQPKRGFNEVVGETAEQSREPEPTEHTGRRARITAKEKGLKRSRCQRD